MNISALKARQRRHDFIDGESNAAGQALVEYSLILALVILACVTIVVATGETIRDELWGMTAILPF